MNNQKSKTRELLETITQDRQIESCNDEEYEIIRYALAVNVAFEELERVCDIRLEQFKDIRDHETIAKYENIAEKLQDIRENAAKLFKQPRQK